MANQAGLTVSQAKVMLGELDSLTQAADKLAEQIVLLKRKILRVLPAKYGSNFWWEKGIAESLEQFEKGNYEEYSSPKEFLASLK